MDEWAHHDCGCNDRTLDCADAHRTVGCSMIVHDSERLSGSLERAGHIPSADKLPLREPRAPEVRSSALQQLERGVESGERLRVVDAGKGHGSDHQ